MSDIPEQVFRDAARANATATSDQQPLPDAAALIQAMQAAGWQIVGQRTGCYVRLALPAEPFTSTVVPVDLSTGDYEHLLRAIIDDLSDRAEKGRRAQRVLDVLSGGGE